MFLLVALKASISVCTVHRWKKNETNMIKMKLWKKLVKNKEKFTLK